MGSRGIRDGLENERRRGGMQTENRSNEEGNDTIPNGDDKGSHLTGSTDMYYSNFTGGDRPFNVRLGGQTLGGMLEMKHRVLVVNIGSVETFNTTMIRILSEPAAI
jgi:hypothetical protein